jgi:AcrR family transcriptional regulator
VERDAANTDSRQRILDAATALFVRDGYKATSVKAIAREVGVSPPALYWHFESKQELYLASMENLLTAFIDSVRAAVTADDPVERLKQFVAAHVRWQLEERDAAGAYATSVGMRDLLKGLPAKNRRALATKQRGYLNLLRGILEEGAQSGVFTIDDERVTAFAIITVCEYVHTWYDPEGELSPDEVGALYADLVLGMVRANTPKGTRRRAAAAGSRSS